MQKEVLSEAWQWRTPVFRDLDRQSLGQMPEHQDLSKIINKEAILNNRGDYLRALSREWWSGKMHVDPIWRYATIAVAASGYVMLLVPTIDITQAVIADLF